MERRIFKERTRNLIMALNKLLNTDLSALARIIQSKGRGKDTVLAHITPQEAALLKARGGRGSINPDTGLPEFELDEDLQIAGASPATEQASVTSEGAIGGQGLVETGGKPSGLGDYSLASGVTTAGLGQTGLPGGTGQGLVDTGASPLYTGAIQTGKELAALPYETSLGPTSQAALQQAQLGAGTKTPEQTGFVDKTLAALGKPDTLGRLGLAGALGAYGALQGKQAQAGSEAAVAQKQALAAPYQQQGQQLVAQAQRGELTAANQQAVQAARARLQQASANMGGVGQQQVESQIAGLTTQLLNNQYQYGLQVMQIGDNIALGAINTQLQLDQQLNQANKSFYTSLAQLVAGSPQYLVAGGTK